MNINVNDVLKGLSERGIEAKTVEVRKNNAILTGITPVKSQGGVTPMVYLESFDGGLNEITDKIAKLLTAKVPKFDLKELLSKEYIENNVSLRLAPENTLKKDIVKKPSVLDGIDQYASVNVMVNGQNGSIKVTDHILKDAGITEDELWNIAKKNTEKTFAYATEIEMNGRIIPIHHVTNTGKTYGASSILCADKMADIISKNFDGVAICMPSSVHEMVMFPMMEDITWEELNDLVNAVNSSEVRPEEQLGNRAYVLTSNGKELEYQTAEEYLGEKGMDER